MQSNKFRYLSHQRCYEIKGVFSVLIKQITIDSEANKAPVVAGAPLDPTTTADSSETEQATDRGADEAPVVAGAALDPSTSLIEQVVELPLVDLYQT